MCRFVHWYGTPKKSRMLTPRTFLQNIISHVHSGNLGLPESVLEQMLAAHSHMVNLVQPLEDGIFGAAMYLKTWVCKGVCQDIYF